MGIQYDVTEPSKNGAKDSLIEREFDEMMSVGLSQAKNSESIPFETAFDSLMKGL